MSTHLAEYEAAQAYEPHSTITLTHGSRWIQELKYFDKLRLFEHTFITIFDDDAGESEVINTAHIISVS